MTTMPIVKIFNLILQHILSEPEEVLSMSGQKLSLKMSVDYISFSAHVDYKQCSEFVRAMKPPHVVRFFVVTLFRFICS